MYLFCVGYPPWRGVDVPFPIPPKLLFLSQQNWFWVFDSAGHREPFRQTLLGYPPHTPRSQPPHWARLQPDSSWVLLPFVSSRLRVWNFISLSSSRLRSEQLSTAIEESSRIRSFKFSIMTMLKKISITIGEKSSRLRSINYSRLCKVIDYDRQLFLTFLKFSTTIDNILTLLKFSTTIEK